MGYLLVIKVFMFSIIPSSIGSDKNITFKSCCLYRLTAIEPSTN